MAEATVWTFFSGSYKYRAVLARQSVALGEAEVARLPSFAIRMQPLSNVVPTDEVVSLKMFHREDEPLERLMLDDEQKRRIDHLWNEHLFISRQAVAENNYLPQFIGFVTQDQPKELLDYFEGQRPVFKKRADLEDSSSNGRPSSRVWTRTEG